MITSKNHLLNQTQDLWSHNDYLQLQSYQSLQHDSEVGPWISSSLPSTHCSIEMVEPVKSKCRPRLESLKKSLQKRNSQNHKQVEPNSNLSPTQQKTTPYSLRAFLNYQDNILMFRSINPKLKRASHLPVISARLEYGDIFKYTKPMECQYQSQGRYNQENLNRSLTKSKSKRQRSVQGRDKTYSGYKSNANRERLSREKSSLIRTLDRTVDEQKLSQQSSPLRSDIQKYINPNNKNFDIYERCIVPQQKKLKQKQRMRMNYYKFV